MADLSIPYVEDAKRKIPFRDLKDLSGAARCLLYATDNRMDDAGMQQVYLVCISQLLNLSEYIPSRLNVELDTATGAGLSVKEMCGILADDYNTWIAEVPAAAAMSEFVGNRSAAQAVISAYMMMPFKQTEDTNKINITNRMAGMMGMLNIDVPQGVRLDAGLPMTVIGYFGPAIHEVYRDVHLTRQYMLRFYKTSRDTMAGDDTARCGSYCYGILKYTEMHHLVMVYHYIYSHSKSGEISKEPILNNEWKVFLAFPGMMVGECSEKLPFLKINDPLKEGLPNRDSIPALIRIATMADKILFPTKKGGLVPPKLSLEKIKICEEIADKYFKIKEKTTAEAPAGLCGVGGPV